MNKRLRQRLAPVASLRLTVALMAISMGLIFASTWALIDRGIAAVVSQYYRTFVVWIELQIFLPRQWETPLVVPWPGGYLIGMLLVINLLAAHAVRFQFTVKRTGILLIHAAVLLFLVGEAITAMFAVESQMPMYEGETLHWSQDIREVELAIVDHGGADHDVTTVIRQSRLKQASRNGTAIQDHRLPFDVHPARWVDNARLVPVRSMENDNIATRGYGISTTAKELPEASGVEGGGVNLPAAWITLTREGTDLGTYLVSPSLQPDGMPYKLLQQDVPVNGRTYSIYLRFRRHYHGYAVTLVNFRHDKYTGSEVAKNFSSDIRVDDPATGEQRRAHIAMNEPLRYREATFYQSGYIPPDRGTVLQVMRNPGMPIPYIAFATAGLGLLLHFGMMLVRFAHRQQQAGTTTVLQPKAGSAGYYFAWAAPLIAVAVVIFNALPRPIDVPYDLRTYGTLPVSYKGRVKPMDTIARNMLLMLNGREKLEHDGAIVPPIHWLADVLGGRPAASDYRIFLVHHPEVRTLLAVGRADDKRLSHAQINPHLQRILSEARRANDVPKRLRDSYDTKILELASRVMLYRGLWSHDDLYLVPPGSGTNAWRTLVDVAESQDASDRSVVKSYARMRKAYGAMDIAVFNDAVLDHAALLHEQAPRAASLANFETRFNAYAPFSLAQILYLMVMLMTIASWLGVRHPLSAAAYRILAVAFLLHSAGLVARIVLSGRPPVTNLYSSAVFIGWGCILFCLTMERINRSGLLTLIGSACGFLTLLVAASLAGDGDTMAVLVAVLDTNFWLATHVVIVTLGYSATFLAGMIGIAYILGGLLTRFITRPVAQRLGQMLYGVIAFALVFSLVGTVLGGIWADQSWGRFWGWDPKENGALLIVLWNALILHARWAGLAKTRGIAALAIFGNIVTSWSWFGTNMLGVGFHSYGFIDSAVLWLSIFMASQFVILGCAGIPTHLWRSEGPTGRRDDQESAVNVTPPGPMQ